MPDASPSAPRTLLDKIWDEHVVHAPESGPAILYIDLHLVHVGHRLLDTTEVTQHDPERTPLFGRLDHWLCDQQTAELPLRVECPYIRYLAFTIVFIELDDRRSGR